MESKWGVEYGRSGVRAPLSVWYRGIGSGAGALSRLRRGGRLFGAGILLLAACAGTQAQPDGSAQANGHTAGAAGLAAPPGVVDSADLAAAAAVITPEAVRERVNYLASDELRGRDTPSPGLESAAEFIVREFQAAGVQPAGDNGTYLQRWPYPVVGLETEQSRVTLRTTRGAQNLRQGAEFAGEPAAPGTAEGGLVVTGTARQLDGLSAARGQIAVVFISTPEMASMLARTRARAAAQQAGARAILFVLDPDFSEGRVAALARDFATTRRIVGEVDGIPSAYVTHASLNTAFREAGVSLDDLRRRALAGPITATPVNGVTASVATPVRVVEDARPPNVVGIVRGSDPVLRDTYVVLSAHMDHVGASDRSGTLQIFNGADDNASGTTGVMMIARAMAALETKPARSVIFLLVSGEEKGLLGSQWFSDHPTVPVGNIVANLNMDMIGRNHADSIAVLGQEYSSLGPLVHRVNNAHPELRMTVAPDLWPQEQLFFRSDQFNFARKEIPNLFFFAGLHEDYHQPTDTADKINADKVARVAQLVFYAAHELASEPQAPTWTPQGLAEVRRMTQGN
jgi:hypothetical protein